MSDLDIVGTYCRIDSAQKEYLRSLWPWVSGRQDGRARPSTVILEADKDLPAAGDDGSLAVRVPQSLSCYSQLGEKGLGGQADGLPKLDFLIKLLKRVNTPIVATSLNISGKKPIARISSGHTSLGMAGIDLILAAGYARKKKPSQLIDVRDINNIRILRK
jgi:tRNA A37 threonylcarbamoyladenosine synthetase subunit TsaC/SUA5/YrdC